MNTEDAKNETELAARLICASQRRGHMTRDDLVAVAKWKWRGGRTRNLCRQNTKAEVEEITRVSFTNKDERLRIYPLMELRGVGWPMASVILHFAFPCQYPILDVRAMNTVDGTTDYGFKGWMAYVDLCRQKAAQCGVTMRTLDKALWQRNGRG